MTRAQSILLLGLLAGLLGLVVWIRSGDRPAAAPISAGDTATALASAPAIPDQPALAPAQRSAASTPIASLPATGPETAPPSARDEFALAALLRARLPDRFGELSNEEIQALTDLNLRGAELTDADLSLLRDLPNLEHLSLYGSPVTDAGLVHLAGLTKLQTVILRGTEVTGVGLQHLPTQNLTALHLCNSAITAEDLAHTPVMPNLEKLKLNFLGFEDGVIERLDVYPALKHIELDQAKISDQGLARLLELNPGLERVEIRNTPVSADAVAALRERYPLCDFATE